MKINYPGLAYNAFGYPAGELQVRLHPETITAVQVNESVTINARLSSATDLVNLVLLCNAIRGVNPAIQLTLNLPYLPYARADRRFVEGDCLALATMGDFLRICRFAQINALDVHSPVAARQFVASFLRNVSAEPLIARAIDHFCPDAILFPDDGAAERYPLECEQPQFYATKQRDPKTGALFGLEVPDLSAFHRVLIVDDLCDGGGTFVGISEELGRRDTSPELGLYVTHGIFSKGVYVLATRFSHVYTTDSFKKHPPDEWLTVYDAFEAMQ